MLWRTPTSMERWVPAMRTRARISLASTSLVSKNEFEDGEIPYRIGNGAGEPRWAGHIVFLFSLWLGTMPALLKAWLEQTVRPGITLKYLPDGGTENLLSGKSARVVVTMGMPAPIYRFWFFNHWGRGIAPQCFQSHRHEARATNLLRHGRTIERYATKAMAKDSARTR